VVEATLGSGSLKTAEYALEQGREVFAIPGSIHSPLSRGCHALIRQGAMLVQDPADLQEALGRPSSLGVPVGPGASDHPASPNSGSELAKSPILSYIGYECTSLDSIIMNSGLTIGQVSVDLLDLELRGYIAEVPGGYLRLSSPSAGPKMMKEFSTHE